MLKISSRRKMPVTEQLPRVTKIVHPTPRRRINPLKEPSTQQQFSYGQNSQNVTEELKNRLAVLQRRVKEWKQEAKSDI
ncbi:uncharacterized protein LOC108086893 [Drosophila ficusphila]|uniref:uncharacterized protein LOC108086893 n=1 Tax=Drosophila ficusphila TaxID=30025 RepID=UPI0007E5F51F|nr:uncharacterized protein LOC108086893 [Drosophila ficusphila]